METPLEKSNKLQKYLGPFEAFALSIGCGFGWGTFVMPYTYFLPLSGTLGTLIGMVVGAILMIIIGYSYHYMMNKFPSAGGALTYTTKAFGSNHGFLCAWFLGLTYVAMLWANATAFILLARAILGTTFQFGFHYQISGFDIYLGEILLSMAMTAIGCCFCLYRKKLTARVQVGFAVILLVGLFASY